MRPSHLDVRYRHELSPRQREVMNLLAKGQTNAEIANRLGLSLDGAKYHVREILGKLGADSREEAVEIWGEMPSRPIGWARFGVAGAWAGKAAAVAAVGGVVVLAAVAFAILGPGGDARPSSQDVLPPTQAPPVSAIATPTVPPAALADCTSTEVALSLQAVDRGDNVLLRMSAAGPGPCQMVGPMSLGLVHAPVDPAPGYPFQANIARDLKVSLVFPYAGVIGEWKWENWCAGPMSWVFWQAKLNTPSSIQVALGNDVYPPCLRPNEPTTLARETSVAGLEGGPTANSACLQAGFPVWLCEFAASIAVDSAAAQQRLFPQRATHDQWFLCDGTGSASGLGVSTICAGIEAHTSVEGFWLATAVGPGAYVARKPFESSVNAALPAVAGIRAIACADGDGPCRRFAIAVGQAGSQAVTLIFRLEPGREPAIIGARITDTSSGLTPLESPIGSYDFTKFPGGD